MKKLIVTWFSVGLVASLLMTSSLAFATRDANNPEDVLEDKAEAQRIFKEVKEGKRERMDYPVKIYNAKGDLVLETTEGYLRKHRKEIEKKYNLVPNQSNTDAQPRVTPEKIQKFRQIKQESRLETK
ncbi:hypothetical protein MFMK1_002932 [Metallumcola ferriviriculae]|uniref:Uncharacterized protein n=1 Tax=Metallumcola ferriviriculae TaxID=3039180 RepID=A0AAU0US10_9FIRM|nr:hypothetical protein MFMK1_002932 [Desulfitibacteraceae bacterium MK1]